jgi:hypothetical protein
MKNLPCYIFLAAIASLVLLTAVSSLVPSISFIDAAVVIVGFSGAAGVIALFLADYTRRSYDDRPDVSAEEPKREVAPATPAAVSRRHWVLRNKRPATGSVTNAMAALRLGNDPATLSMR